MTESPIPELQGLLAGATPLPWKAVPSDDYEIVAAAYPTSYPHRFPGDDTGSALAVFGNRPADFGEANRDLVVAAVNALPDLLASLSAKDAEREIMVAALLDIAKTSRDEGGCFYNNRISISRARDTLKEIGIDWLNPARALHESPETEA